MNSTNKQKEAVTSEAPSTKKLSRMARKRRNKRLKWEREYRHEQNGSPHVREDVATISSTNKFIWKARTDDDKRQIVVKFAQTYNVEAHKLCAEQGLHHNLSMQAKQ